MAVTFSLDRDPLGQVAPGVVAMLRLPMAVTGMDHLVKALKEMYGPGLVILTDAPQPAGWMVVSKPATEEEEN